MKKRILFITSVMFLSAGLLYSGQTEQSNTRERLLPEMAVTYKSAYNSFLAAQLKILPPVTFLAQPGTLYSMEKWELPSPLGGTSAFFNGLGLGLAFASVSLYNGSADNQAQAPGYMSGAIAAYSCAYAVDMLEGTLVAMKNADAAVSKLREADYEPFDGNFIYKDPCMAAGLSFISPALGSLYLGNWKTAVWWASADVIFIVDLVSMILSGGRTGGEPALFVDQAIFIGYMGSKIAGVYMNSFATDELNVKYIIQELRAQKTAETKYVPVDPGFVLTMSLTMGEVLPGAGSLYAGNMDSFISCLLYGIAGIGLYASSFGVENPNSLFSALPDVLRITGSALYSFARMSDLINAPAYAQLKNSIYDNKPAQKQAMTEAFFMPYIYGNAAGLTFAMSY